MSHEPILLVDDENDALEILERIVKRHGYEPIKASSGEDALRIMADRPVHLVILDLVMPKMSGMDVLREIQAKHPGTCVFMLTGHGDIESAVEALKLGAYDYVQKPSRLAEIDLKLDRAVEQIMLRRENLALKQTMKNHLSENRTASNKEG